MVRGPTGARWSTTAYAADDRRTTQVPYCDSAAQLKCPVLGLGRNPRLVTTTNRGGVLHELLHNLGLTDAAIQGALHLMVNPNYTDNITQKLATDCVPFVL
jgi:hypothetical protein